MKTGPLPIAALLVILAGGLVVATGLGSSFIGPSRVAAALLGNGSRTDEIIVWTLRLPRVALATLAGMALGLSGAILQRALRNPMAAPSILGVTDGAALGVVTFLWFFSDDANVLTVSIHWQPLAAVAGAFAFAFLVGLLTVADRARNDPVRLILYGIALAALAKACVTLMMIVGPVYRASQALQWITGSVNAAHWMDVGVVAAGLALSVPVLILMRLPLRQIVLDRQTAITTGLQVNRHRIGLLVLSVMLTALAISQVGAISFVGLIAPHAARLFHGQFRSGYLLGSALIGGILVLAADTFARTIASPLELPAGAVTALIGAPLFLLLILRRQVRNG
ncbi:iron ABC transporter permease [Martelella lutilitoris]|uniref:Iron ABC transporter permease n=1 Tax=Martelella lutilitoris TaxID=2583532 RepID=A0A7T7HNL1_9HYPH|nr:iron ABC transporter permease [Martelella lutilitoris]QQM32446.1 iron ABC transporter permease [Martelella lutilitoris]